MDSRPKTAGESSQPFLGWFEVVLNPVEEVSVQIS